MVEVPQRFYCPISRQIMFDPVVASDGRTYERDSIEIGNVLVSDHDLAREIRAFIIHNPQHEQELYFSARLKDRCISALENGEVTILNALVHQDKRLLTRDLGVGENTKLLDLAAAHPKPAGLEWVLAKMRELRISIPNEEKMKELLLTKRLGKKYKSKESQILNGHTNLICCLKLMPDGQLVSGSSDNTIKVWDITRGQCVQTLQGHTSVAYCLQPLPDNYLASGSGDNTIKIWDINSGRCTQTLQGHTRTVAALHLLPDGRLVSCANDNTIKIWDITRGQCIQTLHGHSSYVWCLQMLPNGQLISGSYDSTIKVWDITRGQCTQTLQAHTGGVHYLQLLSDGRLVSCGSDDNAIKVWDLHTGQVTQTLRGHTAGALVLQLLPNGELVSGGFDSTLRVWDLNHGQCIQILNGPGENRGLTLTKDGQLISSFGNTIKIWIPAKKALEEKRSYGEIRKAARLLAQGYRTGSLFARLPAEINVLIASFTRNPQRHNKEEACQIATKYFRKP